MFMIKKKIYFYNLLLFFYCDLYLFLMTDCTIIIVLKVKYGLFPFAIPSIY